MPSEFNSSKAVIDLFSFSLLTPGPRWSGEGVDEQAVDVKTGKAVVKVDPKYFRPAEVESVVPYFSSK